MILLNTYVFYNRMTSRIGGGDRQHQSNS